MLRNRIKPICLKRPSYKKYWSCLDFVRLLHSFVCYETIRKLTIVFCAAQLVARFVSRQATLLCRVGSNPAGDMMTGIGMLQSNW